MKYKQCTLAKENKSSNTRLVTYIPDKFAIKDTIIKLKNEHGIWEDGWKVIVIGSSVDEKMLPNSHNDIKAHRKATGDSMRKLKD